MNGALKSKTMWFAAIAAVGGAVQQMSPFIPPDKMGAVVTGLGIISAVLRMVTTKPLSEKGTPES